VKEATAFDRVTVAAVTVGMAILDIY